MMLASLKKLFSGARDYPVETYGKLPCYKDYISVIMTEGAVRWRTWLLNSFQEKFMPPEGIWRFIYQHRKGSDLVVGTIQASSDGLRPFPFTLFTVCRRGSGKDGLCSQSVADSIWQQLEDMCQPLIKADDIQVFYAHLNNKRISFPTGKHKDSSEVEEFFCSREGIWPRMLVAAARDSRMLHLVKDGKTTNEEFAQNWQGLMAKEALM